MPLHVSVHIYDHLQGAHERCFMLLLVNSRPTHTTDDNDIWPHTVQEHNKHTSTEFNLVTAQSTAHEPPEDGRIYGPKYVAASFFKVF